MKPVDFLTFSFLLFLSGLTLFFFKQIPQAYLILSVYIILMGVLALLIYSKNNFESGIVRLTHELIFPFLTVLLIFNSLGGLIQYINPATYDDLLVRIDYILFRGYPTVALEKFTIPLMTELLQFAYTSYYFLPLILCIALKTKGKNTEFEKSLFLIVLCFFLSYIGYILVPAIGPRYTMNHLQSVELKGIYLRESIDTLLNSLEGIKRDAFPSGHTAVALVVCSLSFKYQRNLFWIFLPLVTAMIVSTVYLRYHYVIDVIAGFLLFGITLLIGNKYYNYREMKYHEKNTENT